MTLLLALVVLLLIAILGAVLIGMLEQEQRWKREKREMDTKSEKGNH